MVKSTPDVLKVEDVVMDDGSRSPTGSSRSDKLAQLKALLDQTDKKFPEKAGDTWYIISARWYAQLKKYLEHGGENETTNPGVISNEEIIYQAANGDRVVKDTALVDKDFVYLDENAWTTLVKTFGLGKDQTLPANVYETEKRELKIETRRIAVDCCLYPNIEKTVRTLRVSRAMTLLECTTALTRQYDLGADIKHRIWLYSPEGELELPQPSGKGTINDLDLSTQHVVVMELAEDDEWPLDDSIKKDKLLTELRRMKDPMMGDASDTVGRYNLRSNQNGRDTSSADNSHGAGTGLIGLGNLGNTCFMNSSIQCMSNLPELTQYFLSHKYAEDINTANPLGKKGEIANAYADLIGQIWNSSSAVYPNRFKGILNRHNSLFNGSQQDAQESLQFIVDCLHEDLNRIIKKPYFPNVDDNGNKTDEEVADEAWDKYKQRDNSIIVDLLAGQIQSTVKCPDCPKVSVTFDPVFYYQLPLPSTNQKKIEYVFVPYKTKISPSKCKLEITNPKSVTMGDVFAKISAQLEIKENYLLFVEVFGNHVYKIYDRNGIVEKELADNVLVVYELPMPVENPKFTPVFVYLAKSSDPRKFDAFAKPVVLSLPSKDISAKSLYACVYQKILRFMDIPDNFADELEKSGEADDEDSVDEDSAMDVEQIDDDDDANLKLMQHVPANFFTISTTNMNGNTELKKIKRDQTESVRFSESKDGYYIVVTFTEDRFKKLFKKKKNFEFPTSEASAGVGSWGSKKEDAVDLRDCFQLYVSPETLKPENMWRCPDCKADKQARKKLDLWRMPKYMIVHLKRFQYNRFYREKIGIKVRFPLRNFDLSELIKNDKERPALYDVVSMSCHSGGLGGGHYWAICQNTKNGKWYRYDDSRVSEVSEKDIENDSSPYIILFRRQDDKRKSDPHSSTLAGVKLERMDTDDMSDAK